MSNDDRHGKATQEEMDALNRALGEDPPKPTHNPLVQDVIDDLERESRKAGMIPLPTNVPRIPISDEEYKRYTSVPVPKGALQYCHECGGSWPCPC